MHNAAGTNATIRWCKQRLYRQILLFLTILDAAMKPTSTAFVFLLKPSNFLVCGFVQMKFYLVQQTRLDLAQHCDGHRKAARWRPDSAAGAQDAGAPVGGIRILREAGTSVLSASYLPEGSAVFCRFLAPRKVRSWLPFENKGKHML